MTEHQAHKPARLWRRAAARLLDTGSMAAIEAVMTIAAFMIAALVVRPNFLIEDERQGDFNMLWVLLMVPASIPAYLFEVGFTARFGQTFGKRLADIHVVRWDGEAAVVGDQARLAHWRSGARWAIPHVPGIVAAVVAGIVALPGVQDAGDFWGPVAGAAVVPWALVYASSLWDKNRRGWHDKAAGTIVVDDLS